MNWLTLEKLLVDISNFDSYRRKLEKAPYGLLIHEEDDLIILKHLQGLSNFEIPLVRECRGIIINRQGNVVCRPFNKFFNYGEDQAIDIDWNNAYALEKVDGSTIRLYYYKGEWKVSTNGTFSAQTAYPVGSKRNFLELFYDVINPYEFEVFCNRLEPEYTYIFELVHPESEIIVDYAGVKELVFIGCIHNNTGKDIDIWKFGKYFFNSFNVRFPIRYSVDSLANALQLVNDLRKNSFIEGLVVYSNDASGLNPKRIKIKHEDYFKAHYVAGTIFNKEYIYKIFLEGETSEFESYFEFVPENIQQRYHQEKEVFNRFISVVEVYRDKYSALEAEIEFKDIALKIQDEVPKAFQGIVFYLLRHPDDSALSFIKLFGVHKLIKLIGKL